MLPPIVFFQEETTEVRSNAKAKIPRLKFQETDMVVGGAIEGRSVNPKVLKPTGASGELSIHETSSLDTVGTCASSASKAALGLHLS